MKRQRSVLAGAGVLLAAAVAGGAVAISLSGSPATPAAQDQPASTVKVVREQLSAMVSLSGTLTYRAGPDGSPYPVMNEAGGTYTELPALGQVIAQGQVLYRVDDRPVVLLYGQTPSYRSLSAGATGADVVELNADLVALGFARPGQLSPTSATFGPATTTAVEKLQAALGVTPNGTLGLGQAVFEPGAVRVATLPALLGGGAEPSRPVIGATSTVRQVEVALDASQQSEVRVGDKVTITLPDDRSTPGVVTSLGTVANCPPSSTPSSVSPGTGSCALADSGGGGGTGPTVTVGVTPTDPAATGTSDQAPVQVTITTGSVPAALVVPVTALLARSGGGYAVEVVDPAGAHSLVPVSLGLFDDADGLVQVAGAGLAAGAAVVVPTT